MTAQQSPVRITLRIPGAWSNPGELLERLPDGFRLTPEKLFMPDGSEIDFTPMPADDQFARIFETSCRQAATDDELETIARYTVNIVLGGPGGSMDAAIAMLQAGAAIIRAGGAGVFIDNSALSHGGESWLKMADDARADAVSFAFVTIVNGERGMWTMGMHVMGYPDLVMRSEDLDDDEETIVEVLRYICRGEKPIGDGHLLAGLNGPRYQLSATPDDERNAGSPMHNPFGRLRLTSMKDIAEGN